MNSLMFVIGAAVLGVMSKAPAVVWLFQQKKRYNNRNPRQQFHDHPTSQRLYAAHINTLEAFPLFAAGMIVGHFASVDPYFLSLCGWGFIVLRIVYIALYGLDMHWQRSLVWFLAWIASIAPMILAIQES